MEWQAWAEYRGAEISTDLKATPLESYLPNFKALCIAIVCG